jgi:hypothetical protein
MHMHMHMYMHMYIDMYVYIHNVCTSMRTYVYACGAAMITPYTYALYVYLIRMPYMYALSVCLICMI